MIPDQEERTLLDILKRMTAGIGTFNDALRIRQIIREREAVSFTAGIGFGVLLSLLIRWLA